MISIRRASSSLALALLAGCAPKLTSVQGQDLASGRITPSVHAPAVRVGSKANLLHQGKRFKFDVWIEADSSKGRLDALGPFGTPLATLLWQDSSWQAWLPGQGTLVRGVGGSINLPVLGLKDVRPAALVAPLLGRTLPVSGPIRTTKRTGVETMILPDTADPTWSLLLATTGLPSRRSTLLHGREVEGLTFHRWKRYGDILVPRTIDRTTPDGQLLQLEVEEWTLLPEVPAAHLQLIFQAPVDTITLTKNARGQSVFRIRTAVGNGSDSTSVLPAETSELLDASPLEAEPSPDDSLLESDTLEQDSTEIDEEQEDSLDDAPRSPDDSSLVAPDNHAVPPIRPGTILRQSPE